MPPAGTRSPSNGGDAASGRPLLRARLVGVGLVLLSYALTVALLALFSVFSGSTWARVLGWLIAGAMLQIIPSLCLLLVVMLRHQNETAKALVVAMAVLATSGGVGMFVALYVLQALGYVS